MSKSKRKFWTCQDPASQDGVSSYCGSGHVLEQGQDYCGELDCCYNVWGKVTRAKKALAPYQEAKDSFCQVCKTEETSGIITAGGSANYMLLIQVGSLHQPQHCEECVRVEMESLEEGEEGVSLPREQWLPPVLPKEYNLSCICWSVLVQYSSSITNESLRLP